MLNELATLCVPHTRPTFHRIEADDRRFADHLIPLEQWDDRGAPFLAVLGVPQDEGVRRNGGRPGAADAPAAIYNALVKLTTSIGDQSLPPYCPILDCGLLRTDAATLEDIHVRQQRAVGLLLDWGASVVVFGGGHDTALPNGRALGARSERLGIVNVDAHLDVRPRTDEGSHSGSPFRELLEDPACHLHTFVEFGIQPFAASAHHVAYVLKHGHTVWMLDAIRRLGIETAIAAVKDQLQRCDAVHLSLDVDALASAYAPGVSAPVSDGFCPEQMARIITQIAALSTCRVVDIVEVNPRYDTDGRTARLAAYFAAHVLWTFAHRV
ncbi:MAG: formimidoylglutamase [Chlorobi bacterium]|nr:formimidoylglutamase [Chlorobiota bacterium]